MEHVTQKVLLREVAVRNLLIDHLSAETHRRLTEAGIECMLMKGPVIGEALYRDTVRGYIDCDLLVRHTDWEAAIGVLVATGFSDHLGQLAHPRMESAAGMAFVRGMDNIDLHCTIPGLAATPDEVWDAFRGSARPMVIGGREIPVPDVATMLMHIALHASHHLGREKPSEDLRRALQACDCDQWRGAAALARRLGGLPSFSAGLRSAEPGVALAVKLGVDQVGSLQVDLQHSDVPIARGLHQLLDRDLSWGQRARMISTELFPTPSFMRWRSAVARRGRRGLLASYPLRWLWLAARLPRGLIELVRLSRRHRRR